MYQNTTKEVFKMSIPMFFELLLQLLVGNIDQIMVSRYSQGSVAAIGNGNQIMNIVILVLSSMTVATTVLISRYFGAGDPDKAKEVSNVSITSLSIFSILVTILIFVFQKPLFTHLRVPDDIMGETCSYTVIVAGCIVIQAIYMVFAAILRSHKLMKQVTIVALIMNSLNIFGNAVLINGLFGLPRMGIIGAAISTDISKIIGLIIIVIVFLRKTEMGLDFLKLKNFSIKMTKKLLLIAIPSGGEAFSYQMSQLIILGFVNTFGTMVIASRSYCMILANIAYVYSMAIAQASQVLVGYLYGKGDYDSIKKRVWNSVYISIAVSVSITIIFLLNSRFVLGIFTSEEFILDLCKKILFIEIFLEIGRSINISMVQCLVATGDVNIPVILCLFSAWTLAVGLSYVFGIQMGMGLIGIWIAMAIDECFRGVAFIIRFKQEKWRLKRAIE